jgi:hypothetical protein
MWSLHASHFSEGHDNREESDKGPDVAPEKTGQTTILHAANVCTVLSISCLFD